MEINLHPQEKLVEIWLTNEEKANSALRERLKPLYQEFHRKKYFVAVFESGTRDLADATGDLLCYNRKRIAQLEIEREKEAEAPVKQ